MTWTRWFLILSLAIAACGDDGGSDAPADVAGDGASDVAVEAGADAPGDTGVDVATEVVDAPPVGPRELEYTPLCMYPLGESQGPCPKAEALDFGEIAQGETATLHMDIVNSGTVGAWLQMVASSDGAVTFAVTTTDGPFDVPLPAQLHLGGKLRISASTATDLAPGPLPEGELTVTVAFDTGNEQVTTLPWSGLVVEAPGDP